MNGSPSPRSTLTPESSPEEVRAAWAAALRSGRYHQTHGTLRCEDRWCLMGVLADLAVEAGLAEWRTSSGVSGIYILRTVVAGEFLASTASIPYEIAEWAGLDDNNPYLAEIDGQRVRAVYLNDERLWNFARLADAVDALGQDEDDDELQEERS